MPSQFDHERLKAYQEALRFVAWVTPIFDSLPKIAARDQLDRASTSICLNLAEGNGKRTYPDRCRYFDIARGSTVECAACLDVLVAKGKVAQDVADEGKSVSLEVVSMTAGLIARFSRERADGALEEEQAPYGTSMALGVERKRKRKEKESI